MTTPTITHHDDGRVTEIWRDTDGRLHRLDGPARIATFPNGYRCEMWVRDGQFHRDGGPAWIETYPDGSRREVWYRDGIPLSYRQRRVGP